MRVCRAFPTPRGWTHDGQGFPSKTRIFFIIFLANFQAFSSLVSLIYKNHLVYKSIFYWDIKACAVRVIVFPKKKTCSPNDENFVP